MKAKLANIIAYAIAWYIGGFLKEKETGLTRTR